MFIAGLCKKGKKIEVEGIEGAPVFETKEEAITFANIESTQMEFDAKTMEYRIFEFVEVSK